MVPSFDSFCRELENRSIQVIEHPCTQTLPAQKCKTCVLGVLLTENGKEIERYMLSWLTRKYNVITVRQPVHGTLFEYPALRVAQLLSVERGEPVLYLHTKGAAHKGRFQRQTVNMWMSEFVGAKEKYEEQIDGYDILLPYSGPQNITWFNGFIASPKAFSSIPPIAVLENRYLYEILFKGSSLRCFGRRITTIQRTEEIDNTSRMYRDVRRFPASYSRTLCRIHNLFLK